MIYVSGEVQPSFSARELTTLEVMRSKDHPACRALSFPLIYLRASFYFPNLNRREVKRGSARRVSKDAQCNT